MAKNLFAGLVKISGDKWEQYESAKSNGVGKIIFADITSEGHVGKYIYANGIEYAVADSSAFADLEARVHSLEEWKDVVNSSIAALDASVKNHEERIATTESSTNTLEVWRTHIDNVSVDGINASVADLSTKMVNANASIADLSTRMEKVEAFDVRIDSLEASMGIAESSINKLETSVGSLLKSATLSATAAENVATVQVDTLTDAGTSATSTITVTGDAYVAVGQSAANAITLTTKLGDIATATEDASGLATAYDVSAFVMTQLGELSEALIFRGGVDGDETKLPTTGQKVGDTYVATAAFNDQTAGVKVDSGDLIIWNGNSWVVVERNLDGAVTTGAALTADNVVLGNGNQSVKDSGLAFSDLQTAIANANNALQTVTASTSTGEYVTINAVKNASTTNVSVGVITHDVSTAASNANGLATALGAKEYVDAKTTEVKVSATLNSSTPEYVDASAFVDAAGRVISASIGVKVATLAEASTGGENFKALADARDVYEELTKVE